jgi:OOP family OmpA-OmpF porin
MPCCCFCASAKSFSVVANADFHGIDMKSQLRHLSASVAVMLCLIQGSTTLAQSSVIELAPPKIQEYWVSITLQPGGALVFDGYAPDAATKAGFAQLSDADINWLKLASGAPAAYQAAATYGLDLLSRMSEGRFSLRGSVATVSGTAAEQADYISLRSDTVAGLPDGVTLEQSQILAPRIEPYQFSVRRHSNGTVVLSGYVPDPERENLLLDAISAPASSTLRYGSGEPVNFAASLDRVMPLIDRLSEGEIRLDGTAWIIAGTPSSAANAAAIRTTLSENRLIEAGWSLALTEPRAPVVTQVAPELADTVDPAAPSAPATSETSQASTTEVTAATKLAEGAATVPQADPAPAKSPTTPPTAAPEPILTPPVAASEVAPTVAPQPSNAAAASDDAAKVALCSARLAEISGQNGILFRSGSAVLAEGVQPVLTAFAQALAICPNSPVDVAGHTDADGEAQANLALSVARAEAVIRALVALNVAPERLYAVGYGESTPVAVNTTPAGKAQNRRIVISVRQPGN